jgi:dihydrofolate synthase/folylpolyglutamate synthase
MDFLGNSRESIGYEKAGIFRQGTPAICGDINPPGTLAHHAASIGADLMLIGRDFEFKSTGDSWTYHQGQTKIDRLPLPALVGDFQLFNAACVITAIEALQQVLPVTPTAIATGLRTAILAGRFQQHSNSPQVILDVAHNPHAASALAENLRKLPCRGRTLAVIAMLADKDIAGVVAAVGMEVDSWYAAGIDNARGASALQLVNLIYLQVPDDVIQSFPDVTSAYLQACMDASENDRIVVFGSFFTVADVMRVLPQGLPDN